MPTRISGSSVTSTAITASRPCPSESGGAVAYTSSRLPFVQIGVMRCLAKTPEERWQSADELLTDIEVFATSGGTTPTTLRPMEASPSAPADRTFAPWWRRPATSRVVVAASVNRSRSRHDRPPAGSAVRPLARC